ncbi:MAG: serine hydrolase [Saprospiraceae bacterium]|nr:serine hydrolase [Saprospiraceae bacterium]
MSVKKILSTAWVILLFYAISFAQSADNESVKNYTQAAESLVLLKNEGNLIPLHHLNSLKIAFVRFGLKPDSELENVLQKYTKIETLAVSNFNSRESAENWVNQQLTQYNLFILGINDFDPSASPDYSFKLFYLNALLEKAPSIAIVLGNKQAFNLIPNLLKARGLIIMPVQNEWSESVAAQVVFGGIGAIGRLQKDLNADFKIGTGLTSEGNIRLGYAPPALVGFDAEKLYNGIQSLVQQGLDSMAYPGAQVLVAKDGKVVYHETFGYHTYDKELPVQEHDIYDFASITKISTSLPSVMRLYGEGKFDINKTLSDYYPLFKHSNKADFTFKRMLTHTSGLMAWIPFWRGTMKGGAKYPWRKRWNPTANNVGNYKRHTFAADSSEHYNIKVTDDMWLYDGYKKEILKAIKKSPIKPEQGYVYSDLHFYLYPDIIPYITGQEFETYLKSTFYEPLGAYTLTFNPWRYYNKNRIIPTERDTFFRRALLHGTVHDEGAAMLSGISGHAGLFGSPGDLAKLMQMYLNGGTYGGEQFIKEDIIKEFTACVYCNEGIHRGIGFDKPLIEYDERRSSVAKDASPESFGHSGYTGTFTWVDPKYNLLYIFFCNRVHPTRDNRKLLDMSIRPRTQQAIYDALLEK